MRASAHDRLAALFPAVGPWTAAALWHGLVELPTPTVPLEPELPALVGGRLAGLARSYCRSRPDDAGLSPRALSALQRASFRWTAGTVATTQATRRALDVLAAAGVDSVVTKGPGIAVHYPDATWRPYSDLDLLVARGDFGRALAALRRAGWVEEQKNHQPHEYFVRFCREGTNLHEGEFGSVDLHHAVPPWVWGRRLDLAGIGPRAREVTVAGTTLHCASPEDNALVAALHVVSDRNQPGMSLLVWRDVLQLVAASDPAVLTARARETGLAGWLHAVLSAVPAAVRPEAFLATLSSREVEHAARLSALLSPRAARMGVLATQVLRLPVLNAAVFAAGMAVPSRAFVREKFAGDAHPYLAWWNPRHRRPDQLASVPPGPSASASASASVSSGPGS